MDTDDVFVAQTMALGRGQQLAEDFLAEVIERLHQRMPTWDWTGIYFLVDDTFVLGPFVGAATEHVRIPVGVGVCGTAVAEDTNLIIDDVRARENYLACSTTRVRKSSCSSTTAVKLWASSTLTAKGSGHSAARTKPCWNDWGRL